MFWLIKPKHFYIFLIGIFFIFSNSTAWGEEEILNTYEPRVEEARSLALYTMGVIYDFYGLTDRAIEEFEKSAVINDNYAVQLRLGANYARVGKLPLAIEKLNTVLQLDPNNVQARYLLALIYSTQKKFDLAAEQYEFILMSFSNAEPENIEIYGYLGQLYYSQKEYDKAIKQYEIILGLDSSNVEVMFILGSLYLEINKKDKAIEIFSRAVKVDPDYDIALNSLGYIYAEEGVNLDEAQKLIERAVQIDPDNGAYLDSLGWVYYKKGNYEKALRYLNEADHLLKDPVIYEHLGDVYYAINQADDAKKYWRLSLDLLPDQGHIEEKLKALN